MGDSPWLWIASFAAAALVATSAIEDRYDGRQQQIERRFHYRVEQLAQQPIAPPADGTVPQPPAERIVTLAPIRWILLAALMVSSAGLIREGRGKQ